MRYIIILVLFMAACGRPDVKTQFDNLEKVFGTANWRLRTVNNDTLYIFFSREGEALYKVYSYMLANGDSIRTVVATIAPKDGEIIWDLEYQYITLKDADAAGSSWHGKQMGDVRIKTIDSLHVLYEWGGNNRDTLVRTLPISTFLIRSKYDFLHGTNTVNEAR